MKRRVAITGLGILSSVGNGREDFWNSLKTGRSGIGKITLIDPSPYRSQIAGEIKGFDPEAYIGKKELKWMDRYSQIAVVAAQMAVEDAGLTLPEETGLIIGTGIGGVLWHEDAACRRFYLHGPKGDPSDILKIMCNAAAAHISMRFGIKGEGFTVVTACASGTQAIGEAYRHIKHGYADVMMTGGTDVSVSPTLHSAWCALRVLSTRNDTPETACRPFSKDRDGMVIAEGASLLILEELEHALSRGAEIYGEIIGYATSYDASHITSPNMEGQSAAIQKALKDADITTGDIDYINAHGTATKINDVVETQAIKEVFGDRAYSVPVSSIKSMTGHAMGAAGAIELTACCLALRENIIPPTINYTEPDPECDLDYVPNLARKAEMNIIMSNSFGFGGNNGVIILKRL